MRETPSCPRNVQKTEESRTEDRSSKGSRGCLAASDTGSSSFLVSCWNWFGFCPGGKSFKSSRKQWWSEMGCHRLSPHQKAVWGLTHQEGRLDPVQFLHHIRHTPTSGPWHLLLPLHGMALLHKASKSLSSPSTGSSNVTFLETCLSSLSKTHSPQHFPTPSLFRISP